MLMSAIENYELHMLNFKIRKRKMKNFDILPVSSSLSPAGPRLLINDNLNYWFDCLSIIFLKFKHLIKVQLSTKFNKNGS